MGTVMFDLSFDKLLVVGVVAVMIMGPTRLPLYAAKLAGLIRAARTIADDAKERARDELGADFTDIEWKRLDPRQYDPRRIIRDALFEETESDNGVEPEETLPTKGA
jgi:sec-independent protein translocase protein TatB